VFLAHGTTLLSVFHLPFALPFFSSRPFNPPWYMFALWPLALPIMLLLWLFRDALRGRQVAPAQLKTAALGHPPHRHQRECPTTFTPPTPPGPAPPSPWTKGSKEERVLCPLLHHGMQH